MDSTPTMLTIGEIARRLGVPSHRVEYILKTRDILPKGIAGNCRVYDEAVVERIAEILRGIDAKKGNAA